MAIDIIRVPDLGGAEEVEVIELAVAVGDHVELEQTLVVLESEKAMMELPAPQAGTVVKILVKEGDKIKQAGVAILELEVAAETAKDAPPKTAPAAPPSTSPQPTSPQATSPPPVAVEAGAESAAGPPAAPPPKAPAPSPTEPTDVPAAASPSDGTDTESAPTDVYAGPAVRQFARQLGADLTRVAGSGPRGRILKEDVQAFVKRALGDADSGLARAGKTAGSGIPAVPSIDFSQFGAVESVAMTKIQKLTATNMHRSWLNVPHVTQFDAADITALEEFRASLKAEAELRKIRLTPLPFILAACAAALRANPEFNRSLQGDGEHFVQKHYIHIGVAVDTPRGLLVPVIRDVDHKGIWQLAKEVMMLSAKARDGKLTPAEMQGGCFTITSLGAQGGTGFTPIINTPEVGILGVSRAAIRPVWQDGAFAPRQLLPLCLSYDHRAINGVDGARFMTFLVTALGDIRRLLM